MKINIKNEFDTYCIRIPCIFFFQFYLEVFNTYSIPYLSSPLDELCQLGDLKTKMSFCRHLKYMMIMKGEIKQIEIQMQ
jgi:hypothetical protein